MTELRYPCGVTSKKRDKVLLTPPKLTGRLFGIISRACQFGLVLNAKRVVTFGTDQAAKRQNKAMGSIDRDLYGVRNKTRLVS